MKVGTKTTTEGTAIVEAAGKAFAEIAGVTAITSREVVDISTMMKVQKDEAQRAAKSVDDIASIAEETASASEESASSTQELTASMEDMTARAQSLSEMAINLQRIASRFKIIENEQREVVVHSARSNAPLAGKGLGASAQNVKLPSKVQESLKKRGLVPQKGANA